MSNIVRLKSPENEALRRAQAKQQEEQSYLEAAEQWLDEQPMHYSAAQGRFLMKCGSQWKFITPEAMKPYCPVWDAKFANAIREKQSERGWLHVDVTYTFRDDLHPEIFNLMDRSGWVQPELGDHHWIFNVLMRSLGCGKTENINHLEHVIVHKFLHPECYLLPCLLIHGEGGTGKNLLVDKVLYTLFDRQAISANGENVIGQFNSLVRGRTVVMINESVSDRTDTAKLKDMLHKERLVINEKGIAQFEIDNTPLYIIASNEHEGGVFLDRSDADRRYSVMRCERGRTLNYWIAQQTGMSQDEARAWMQTDGHRICGDRAEIAKWLGHLVAKYREQGQPVALHGADYAALMDVQKKMEERVVEAVFTDPDFTHIEKQVLYQGYSALCRAANARPLSDSKLYKRVDDWLTNNRPHILSDEVWFDEYVLVDEDTTRKKRKKKRRQVWQNGTLLDIKSVAKRDNRAEFINSDGYHTVWRGPDI